MFLVIAMQKVIANKRLQKAIAKKVIAIIEYKKSIAEKDFKVHLGTFFSSIQNCLQKFLDRNYDIMFVLF